MFLMGNEVPGINKIKIKQNMKQLLTLKMYAFHCTILEMAFLTDNKVHGIR